jgi:hypothetical protein
MVSLTPLRPQALGAYWPCDGRRGSITDLQRRGEQRVNIASWYVAITDAAERADA